MKDSPTTPIRETEEKIWNAICFFASEHERLTNKSLSHTSLYKYLAFLDYASIESTGRRAFVLLYHTRRRDSSPIGTDGKRDKVKNDCFIFLRQGQGRYIVKAAGKPDLNYFSPFELSEMKRLVEVHAHHFAETSGRSVATQGLWKRRGHVGTNVGVRYDDLFDDDFFTKHKEVIAMSSLNTLIEKYMVQMKELETRMADTKHKLEIVLEASRLLMEEGLSDEPAPNRSDEDRAYQKDR